MLNLFRGHVRILEGLLYASLAAVATWPLARHLTSHLPMGTEPVATVPLFNLWTLWWNADRLQALYTGYWDARIFHPVRGAFAFSEPQPLTGLVAAVLTGMSASRTFGYNAVLLLGLTLNGWVASRLLAALGMRWSVCLVGGAMVVWWALFAATGLAAACFCLWNPARVGRPSTTWRRASTPASRR